MMYNVNSIFEEERNGNYTKWDFRESVGFRAIVDFFSFDVFYPEIW